MSRARALLIVDILIATLAVVVLVIAVTGGFFTIVFGQRVSLHRSDRPLIVMIGLAVIRWRVSRDEGFLRQPVDWYRRLWARLYQRDADDLPAGSGSSLSRRWGQAALAAGGLLAAGAVLLQPQLRHMDSVPDLGDPLFSMWRIGWVHRQIVGDPRPLFDANIFHPTPLTLTLSDSMLLPAVTASPLLSAGMAPVVAYNVLFLSAFFLSGLAAYVLIRRVTGSARAAFIGGLLYAFYPYRMEHYSHLELQMTQWMPLALFFLHRFWESLRARDAALAAVCTAAQLYSSMYYGVFFVVYAAAVLGTLFAVSRPGWRRVLGPAAAAAVLGVALAIPLARPYLAAQAMKGERGFDAVAFYSADASDYLRPHPRLATYAGHLLPDIHPERALFPGVTPLVLSAVALVPPVGTVRLAYSVSLAVAFDMSRGVNGILYRHLYDWFPPIRGMRVPARFSVILGISLVLLAGYGARRLLARLRHPLARQALFSALIVSVLIDLHPTLPLMPVWPQPPSIYASLASRTDVVLAEFPMEIGLPAVTSELPFMYFSIWHGLPMVNGYSGFTPDDHEQFVEDERHFPEDAALAALRRRGVTHVTINCALMTEHDDCGAMLARAAGAPALRPIADTQWQGKTVRLYELLRQ